MGKNHLSLIFCFLINIVIFTSASNVDDLFEQFESDAGTDGELALSNDDGDLFQSGTNFNQISSRLNRFKSRRESPYGSEPEMTGDAGERDTTFDDENMRNILNHIVRDVSGKTAATAKSPTDTFNATNIATINNNTADSDLSKTFINNTFDERPAASPSTVTNNKSGELQSVISLLDQMREELELMRMSKQCNSTPDGSNCDVNGSWNSEQIGLRLELENTLTNDKLTVKLSDKAPKKVSAFKIDSSWSCSGTALHSSGPIYFHCLKYPLETVAIFQGMCKKCSGYETIFGQWHFQHNPKDCRQLWTFIESKNDIFRKDVLHFKSFYNDGHSTGIHQTLGKSMNGSNVDNKSKVRRNIKSNHHKLIQKSNLDSF